MGRAILAVIVSYVVMFLITFIALTGAYLAMGTEGAFKEGSFEPATTWVGIMFVAGFVTAVIGGFVCSKIAPRPGPLYALVVVIVLLGLVSVAATMAAEDPGPRSEDLTSMEAMMQAVTPLWVAVGNIVIGVVGVLIGGKKALKAKPS